MWFKSQHAVSNTPLFLPRHPGAKTPGHGCPTPAEKLWCLQASLGWGALGSMLNLSKGWLIYRCNKCHEWLMTLESWVPPSTFLSIFSTQRHSLIYPCLTHPPSWWLTYSQQVAHPLVFTHPTGFTCSL